MRITESFATTVQRLAENDKTLLRISFAKPETIKKLTASEIIELLAALKLNTVLEQIDFGGMVFSSDADFEKIIIALNDHPKIQSFGFTEIDNNCIDILNNKLTKPLKSLNLGILTPDVDPARFSQFLVTCRILRLQELCIEEHIANHLESLSQWLSEADCCLQNLSLVFGDLGDGNVAIAKVLSGNKSLKKLSLEGNLLQNVGAIVLAKALETNTTLQSLNLTDNAITATGGMRLARALKTNKALTELILDGNKLDRSIKQFGDMLAINVTLQKLSMARTELRNDKSLIKVLKENKTKLKTLNLSYNPISDTLTAEYAKALQTNTCLEVFILDGITQYYHRYERDKLPTIKADAFGKMLAANQTLKILSLCNNDIDDVSILPFANGIKSNVSLRELKLNSNKMISTGVKALADALDKPSALAALYLEGEKLEGGAPNALLRLVQHTPGLENFTFLAYKIHKKKFDEAIKNNDTYRKKYRTQFFPKVIEKTTNMLFDPCTVISGYHEFERYTIEPELLPPDEPKPPGPSLPKKQRIR